MGSMLKGPTAEIRRSESFKKTDGVFFLEYTIKMAADKKTPIPHPVRAPMLGISAHTMAQIPIVRAGTKIFL